MDYSRYNPAIDPLFSTVQYNTYLSSTTWADITGLAWDVDFRNGSNNSCNSLPDDCGKSLEGRYVRTVRGGEYQRLVGCNDEGDCNAGEICENGQCVCTSDSTCDDGLFCTGVETCVSELCVAGTNPCLSEGLLCNEDIDQCVECFDDSNCPVGKECVNGACVAIACTEYRNCPSGFGCVEGACVQEAPPVIDAPLLAAGSWPVMPNSAATAFTLKRNRYVLWTFEDDYATCGGLCTNRAKYRRLDGTQWFELQAEADASGKWYAMVELPVNNMRDGTYVFQFEIVDCFGQITSSRYYYFKVAHPL